MSDFEFVEEGNIRIYEYPNSAEIVNISEKINDSGIENQFSQVVIVKTKEEAECIIESMTRFIESFNNEQS